MASAELEEGKPIYLNLVFCRYGIVVAYTYSRVTGVGDWSYEFLLLRPVQYPICPCWAPPDIIFQPFNIFQSLVGTAKDLENNEPSEIARLTARM